MGDPADTGQEPAAAIPGIAQDTTGLHVGRLNTAVSTQVTLRTEERNSNQEEARGRTEAVLNL